MKYEAFSSSDRSSMNYAWLSTSIEPITEPKDSCYHDIETDKSRTIEIVVARQSFQVPESREAQLKRLRVDSRKG